MMLCLSPFGVPRLRRLVFTPPTRVGVVFFLRHSFRLQRILLSRSHLCATLPSPCFPVPAPPLRMLWLIPRVFEAQCSIELGRAFIKDRGTVEVSARSREAIKRWFDRHASGMRSLFPPLQIMSLGKRSTTTGHVDVSVTFSKVFPRRTIDFL